jgi:adenine C2-methylase RlmN of 23S rRNA A2503 and tRNA A37
MLNGVNDQLHHARQLGEVRACLHCAPHIDSSVMNEAMGGDLPVSI